MGAFKPLLDLGGKPVIRRTIDALRRGGVAEIAVVTGYKRELLLPEIGDCREVFNADFHSGMFSSVCAGLADFLLGSGNIAVITPADCPLISVPAEFSDLRDSLAVPTYNNERGHPLAVPRSFLGDILKFEGGGGLRAAIATLPISEIATDNPGVLLDMDYPEDAERLRVLWRERYNNA
jgi:CTP:molybdopterin cytidylyltransferase MocA